MEPSESSCQRDMAADESKSESEPESDSSLGTNNSGLQNKKSNISDEIIERDLSAGVKECRLKDREERPLVLEERHSLSIAETKKRRASVYSNENLFIPKKLARGELHHRRHQSAASTLDPISRNSDYCIRMLKFPVGSGRARYVAQQMKRKKTRKPKEIPDKDPEELQCPAKVDITKDKFRIKRESSDKLEYILPLSMPNLDAEHTARSQLDSDDECCIILEDIVGESLPESEEDGTEELIERVSKRQLKRAAGTEFTSRKHDQHLPLFRWHNPHCSDQDLKMGLMEDLAHISLSANADIHVGFNEVAATATVADPQREQVPDAAEEQQVVIETGSEVGVAELAGIASNEIAANNQHLQPERSEIAESVRILTTEQQLQVLQNRQETQQYQQHIANVPYMLPETVATSSYQTYEAQRTDMPLPPQFMQRINLPQLIYGNSASSNAVGILNESMQHQFVESLLEPEYVQQWSEEYFEKYAYSRTGTQQQQLSYALQRHQLQQHNYQEQQLNAGQKELQQLNTQYQHLKCQEAEQLKQLNKALKDVYASRLHSERQHAEYHRAFMHKMVDSKKQEETLQAQKKHLKKQLQADLSILEQRLAKKQRQLHELSRTWQWQQEHQQQQQQQHQLQLQQHQQHQQQQQQQQQHQHQHFLRQLPPPIYQPRLQCFQDAFSQCIETQLLPTFGPTPASTLQPEVATISSESSNRAGNNLRRRHTIDYRLNSIVPYGHPPNYPQSPNSPAPSRSRPINFSNHVHPTVISNVSTAPRFTLPETSISTGTTKINQAIEQTVRTSIIGNYVSNYLKDTKKPDS